MLLAAACSGGGDPATNGATASIPTADAVGVLAAETAAYAIPPRELAAGLVGLDDADLANSQRFVGLVDLVERGVEAEVWTEPEGVIALLRAQVGEIPRASIEGLDLVGSRSGTSLLALADELAADDAVSIADRDDIERLLAQLTPSNELLDALDASTLESEPSGFRRRPIQAGGCVQPAVNLFPFVDEVSVDCWKVLSHSEHRGAGGGYSQLRIVYPEGVETQAETTMEALIHSLQTGHEWSDANPDTTVLVIPQRILDEEVGSVWGAALSLTDRHCAVTVSVDSELGMPYRQMVAHEQVHCLQFADFGNTPRAANWFIEGGAEYFSHAIYPEGGNERDHLHAFLTGSLTSGLHTMSYQAWPWWQHLSNLSSPATVWDLHRRMAGANAVEMLANEPGMAAIFQSFTIDLTTVGLSTHGAPIAAVPYGIALARVDSLGDRSHTVERFVAARLGISYADKHLFEQTDHTGSGGLMQMVVAEERLDRSAWRGLPPEVRSSCEADVDYIMAATTIEPDPHVVEWSVDVADEYACDPCLGGTWLVDNDSFRDTIMTFATAGIPAGMNFGVELLGPYYVRFDGDGRGNAWRNDWKIVVSGSTGGMTMNIVTTISSIERFEYGADGERFNAWNALVLDYRSQLDMGGLPVGAVATPGEAVVNLFGVEATVGVPADGASSAAGTYTCNRDRLEIALDDAPDSPIVLNRTTDIPEPPVVLPEP